MKREIKFRVWDNVDYMSTPFNLYDGPNRDIQFTHDCPIMQFTGLKDKNQTDIFEGDILRIDGGADIKPVMDVRWENDYAMWVVYPDWLKDQSLVSPNHVPLNAYASTAVESFIAVEVVGNIYQTPELLK